MRSIIRGRFSSSVAAIFISALLAAGEAGATGGGGTPPPPLVPVSETPPLACTTANFTITAVTTGAPNFQFPVPDTCGGVPCFLYRYTILSATSNIDRTLFSVSATQDLFSTSPASTVIQPAYGGDFLDDARHEYVVKFNSSYTKSVTASIWIKPTLTEKSRARIGTVLVQGGKKSESCLIATPGVRTTDAFQPVFATQTAVVAGGKCTATFVFDSNGDLSNVIPTPPCVTNDIPGADVLVNGKPLQNNTSQFGITFGTGTSTCYGPPRPSRPVCICTASPCP